MRLSLDLPRKHGRTLAARAEISFVLILGLIVHIIYLDCKEKSVADLRVLLKDDNAQTPHH